MTNGPSVLAPWYVVYREDMLSGRGEYFRDAGDPEERRLFTPLKGTAQVFDNLQSAARVAKSEGAMIRVLTTDADAKEFGRAGS